MKTCLIVDDSRVVRKVMRRIIEELGFVCNEAENGAEALKACQSLRPDLVMLDWHMPKMNGPEFLEGLQENNYFKNTKVVFCTIEDKPESIKSVMNNGASGYVIKPFDQDKITSALLKAKLLA